MNSVDLLIWGKKLYKPFMWVIQDSFLTPSLSLNTKGKRYNLYLIWDTKIRLRIRRKGWNVFAWVCLQPGLQGVSPQVEADDSSSNMHQLIPDVFGWVCLYSKCLMWKFSQIEYPHPPPPFPFALLRWENLSESIQNLWHETKNRIRRDHKPCPFKPR